MVRVKNYTRLSSRGKRVNVNSYHRKNPKGYNIDETRQLPHRKSSIYIDQMIQAKKPGKRISNSNNVYYERRFNRSDSGDYL